MVKLRGKARSGTGQKTGTDIAWCKKRTIEHLKKIIQRLFNHQSL